MLCCPYFFSPECVCRFLVLPCCPEHFYKNLRFKSGCIRLILPVALLPLIITLQNVYVAFWGCPVALNIFTIVKVQIRMYKVHFACCFVALNVFFRMYMSPFGVALLPLTFLKSLKLKSGCIIGCSKKQLCHQSPWGGGYGCGHTL